jgi:hypothetical protein
MMAFAISMGYITILGHNGDMVCAGTVSDPCIAEATFRANVDQNWYVSTPDPWGRDTLIEFDPAVKSWESYYLDGGEWKELDLSKTIKLEANTEYTWRFVVLKHNPEDRIKWSMFDGELDPVFLPSTKTRSITLLNKVTADRVVTNTYTHFVDTFNEKCRKLPGNDTWERCVNGQVKKNYTITKTIPGTPYQELLIDGRTVNLSGKSLWCFTDTDGVSCVSTLDGDGDLQPTSIKPGVSFTKFPSNKASVFESEGHLSDKQNVVLEEFKR